MPLGNLEIGPEAFYMIVMSARRQEEMGIWGQRE